jgi:choline dehydrogenase
MLKECKITPDSLTTYTNTLAKKVVFDQNKRATGVQVKGWLDGLMVDAQY